MYAAHAPLTSHYLVTTRCPRGIREIQLQDQLLEAPGLIEHQGSMLERHVRMRPRRP
jgi:hypothetical protein